MSLKLEYTLKRKRNLWGTCIHVFLEILDFLIYFCDYFVARVLSLHVSLLKFLDVSASLVGGC